MIISPNIRVRVPEAFTIGQHSVVDDWCYFSTQIEVGVGSHIAPSCTIAGGRDHLFRLGDFSSLSSGCRVYCAANDFVRDLVCLSDGPFGDDRIAGDVTLGDYTAVGANSIIMPSQMIPEGVAIGALSFVPPEFSFTPWTVYAGFPIRPVKSRDQERVLAQVETLRARFNQQ